MSGFATAPEKRVLRFGNFELHQHSGELRKHGLKIKLQQRPLQVLNILLERPGEIVRRVELQRRLWPEGVFVDFDHSLNTAVKKLRTALGDTAASPRYIATVDREGYRFLAPVSEVHLPAPSPAAASLPPQSIPAELHRAGNRSLRRKWWAAVAAVLLVAVAIAAWWRVEHGAGQGAAGKTLIAVLPFDNLTGDEAQDYFSDGLTEEMIAQLGRLDPERLGVVALRASASHFPRSPEQLGQVADQLGVQYLLQGSVRRDANDVRITARLVRSSDRVQLWARVYDRQLSNLLVLQAEIAQEVADETHLTLGAGDRPGAVRPRTLSAESSEAYDLYLKGRFAWNRRTAAGFKLALDCFQGAIAKDPNYARAYAGLADTYSLMSSYYYGLPNDLMPKARAAALKALQLDPTSAEAHTSLALITENYDWDWQTAEKEFREAIQLDTNYATAHQWYGEFLAFQGRFDEALAESERARQLDPLSLIIASDNCATLYLGRLYDRAIQQCKAVLDMQPGFARAVVIIGAYVQKGDLADANSALQTWRPGGGWRWAWEASLYSRAGNKEKVRAALREVERIPLTPGTVPIKLQAYAAAGEPDKAIAALNLAVQEHSNVITTLKVDPAFDPLRGDPRFQEILRKLKLSN
jgi:TolB-like protein/DNA-binding winged helix-turn-helix (wHTH) protein